MPAEVANVSAKDPSSRIENPKWLEKSKMEVENMCHLIVTAINNRDFEPTSPAWNVTDKYFAAKAAFANWPRETDLLHLLECYERHTTLNPQYSLKLDDVTIKIDEKRRCAKAFVNLLSDGIPPGTVRQSVGVLDFVLREDDKWYCLRYQCLPGMAPMARFDAFP